MSFFARLQSCRPDRFDKDADYAKFLGISRSLFSTWKANYEAGIADEFVPTKPILLRISKALKKRPSWLAGYEGKNGGRL
jgi:hypothetical protein